MIDVLRIRQRRRLAAQVESSSTSPADGNEEDAAVATGHDRQLLPIHVVGDLGREDRLSLGRLVPYLFGRSRAQLLP